MGNTALMGVCFKGYTEIAKILLEHGAAVDAENGNGATALTFAATFGRNELIPLLLSHGASPLKKDKFGRNPIDYALLQENPAGYETLVAATRQ
ncbi:ankyrin repeat domain-containing protein [Chitinophaga pinensis]|uniref:ankyrin repeat domain-containing protein n=1 Tax=Chitinophaga pinensis TaxID=79329 RepID=UPI0021BDE7CD|nr:ankyrin repeat domain-containing protein [Chitinophaga pinensis]